MRTTATHLITLLLLTGCGGSGGGPGDGDADGDADGADVSGDGDAAEEDPGEEEPAVPPVEPPALVVVAEPFALTPVAQEAVSLAPDWLQDDLALNLARLEIGLQNEMAGLLLDLEDPDLVDEVAFAIAHTSPEIIEYSQFHSQLFVENARQIYEYDPLLPYADLTEVGVAGVDPDWYTTVTYRVETEAGTVESRTVDPSTYYWYVVHPRLEDEIPAYVNGWVSGDPTLPHLGWHWREFLWDAAAEDCPAERTCPLLSEQMPAIEVFKRASESTAYDEDAIERLYAFEDEILDFGAGAERPVQPNRIYVLECGNCGEYADFFVASARTSLVPARNCGASSNDHTWGEWWWEGDGWHGETWFYRNGVRRDGRDDDCDGFADDGLNEDDADGDGITVAAGDCDDNEETIHPGASEVHNGRDDDCDGTADEGFVDSDLDADGDGYSIASGDCRDADPDVHPGATEVMDNGLDDDCDGTADDGTDVADADADGHAIADGDCDDGDDAVYPGADETANGRDDDCDGTADEGFTSHDRDGDGWTLADGDCDETRGGFNPDAQDPVMSSNRLYAITTTRGDTLLGIDRTEAYATLPSYLEFDILDLDGDPVDGALVTVYGTWAVYGYPDAWAEASEVLTGLDGRASITVGEYNPYGYSVVSAIGDTPGADHLFVAVDETLPYETYTITRQVPGRMPDAPAVTETDLADGAEAGVLLGFDFQVESHRVEGDGKLYGSFCAEGDGGTVDVFLLDEAGWAAFQAGEAFEAQSAHVGAASGSEVLTLPVDRTWTLVVHNGAWVGSTMVGSITVTAQPPEGTGWTADVPDLHRRIRLPPGLWLAISLTP